MSKCRYILDGKTVIADPSGEKWAEWIVTADWRVAQTDVGESSGSTVFLMCHFESDNGPPRVFETLVFGGPLDQETWHYSTWADAEAGHHKAVAAVQAAQEKPNET